MNSTLQIFFHLETLNNIIINNSSLLKNKKLTNAYYNLLKEIELGKKEIINPIQIKKILSEVDIKYKYNHHEDVNKFINLFLNEMLKENKGIEINEEINFPKEKKEKEIFEKFYDNYIKENNSFLLNLFYGIFKKEIYCLNKHKVSMDFELFNSIKIQNQKEENSFENLLKNFQEIKKTENKIECNICGLNKFSYEKTIIFHLPKYLILSSENPITNIQQLNLDINQFSEEKNQKNINYELIGIIGYIGNFKNGHYISKCQVSQNNWFYFSDSYFNQIENVSEIFNDKDIIFFFEKI